MSTRILLLILGLAWAHPTLAAVPATSTGAPSSASTINLPQGKVWGAIYMPFEAYNAPQMWKNFSVAETRRDFGYAKKLNLNALRIWASYEYWKMDRAHFKTSFDQLLGAAHDDNIRILISLFDSNGVPATSENMWTTDPTKAFCIASPGPDIFKHKERWDEPRQFVQWIMENYRNDNRLLAIEVFNEPGKASFPFADSMLRTANSMRGTVPLTMGTAGVEMAERFIPDGLNMMEFHQNFPRGPKKFEAGIEKAIVAGKQYHLPVWLTEWQWVRPSGSGFHLEGAMPEKEKTPDYASLAPIVRGYPIGSFFWSLMVKRAYLEGQRKNGTINGVFWPDGSVWSLQDARAIANDPSLQLPEKKQGL